MSKLDDLLQKKAELEQEQERLINEIKTKHTQVYQWLIDQGVDFYNLKNHTRTLALALTMATTSVPQPTPEISQLAVSTISPDANVIEQDELVGLSEEERAQLVWYRYGPFIKASSEKYNIDQKLIFATIMIESKGDTRAYRYEPHIGDASYGLGQILYGTARGMGFEGSAEDLYDPATNIDLIAKYHRYNQDNYEEELTPQQLTIAYNSGSPYGTPLYGHIEKFNTWYSKASKVMV